MVSSVKTPMAFFRYPHAFSSSSAGTRWLITRSLCAIARATFRLAHQPEPLYGSFEYSRSTRCMKVGWWNRGNMQLKFSKKSLRRERASCLGGNCLKTRRAKMAPKTSGFQYIHLLSSTAEDDSMSWKDLSPVLPLTHCIPLGEKIENPEEDPVSSQYPVGTRCAESIPIYRVSLQLLVTKEHIMSERASTPSLLFFSGSSPFLV